MSQSPRRHSLIFSFWLTLQLTGFLGCCPEYLVKLFGSVLLEETLCPLEGFYICVFCHLSALHMFRKEFTEKWVGPTPGWRRGPQRGPVWRASRGLKLAEDERVSVIHQQGGEKPLQQGGDTEHWSETVESSLKPSLNLPVKMESELNWTWGRKELRPRGDAFRGRSWYQIIAPLLETTLMYKHRKHIFKSCVAVSISTPMWSISGICHANVWKSTCNDQQRYTKLVSEAFFALSRRCGEESRIWGRPSLQNVKEEVRRYRRLRVLEQIAVGWLSHWQRLNQIKRQLPDSVSHSLHSVHPSVAMWLTGVTERLAQVRPKTFSSRDFFFFNLNVTFNL